MATCKECKNCEVHVGYWICNAGVIYFSQEEFLKAPGRKKRNKGDLYKNGAEFCPNFEDNLLELVETIKYC